VFKVCYNIYEIFSSAVLRVLAEEYVRAFQWILQYYYIGVASWAWFYRYHHAPYVSDLKGFGSVDLTFELGAPLLPFQQLMAILPASSKDLVPIPLQVLMLVGSPILDLYRPVIIIFLNLIFYFVNAQIASLVRFHYNKMYDPFNAEYWKQ